MKSRPDPFSLEKSKELVLLLNIFTFDYIRSKDSVFVKEFQNEGSSYLKKFLTYYDIVPGAGMSLFSKKINIYIGLRTDLSNRDDIYIFWRRNATGQIEYIE